MLTIRSEQLHAFSTSLRANFRRRLAAHLAAVAPAKAAHEIESAAERAILESSSYGFHSESAIARFAEITVGILGGFPAAELPVPALAVLMRYGQDPCLKLELYRQWAESAMPSGMRASA